MTHYVALFFVNTGNSSAPFVLDKAKHTTSETVLNEWLVRYEYYPKVVIIPSTNLTLTQFLEVIQEAVLTINEDLNGG